MSNNYRNASVNSISEAIKWAINKYGKEIVKDSNRFKSILMDIYECEERELNLIKLACYLGVYETIVSSNDAQIDLVAKKMIKDLREFHGIATTVAIEIINWLLFALDKELISASVENLGHPANKTLLQGSTKTTANKSSVKSATKVDNSIFTFEKCYYQDGYIIKGKSEMDLKGKIVIPSEYNGKPVVKIGYEAFKDKNSITEVIIPKSVTEISGDAFKGCSSLEAISIPKRVTEIGWGTFWDCSSLKTINIPDSLTKIGGLAFKGCSSLEAISIPKRVTEIGWGTFWDCSSLKTINIPDGVTKIGEYAFQNCSSLETIYIPKSVRRIEKNAFKYCEKLTISAEAKSKPIGWIRLPFLSWNPDKRPVKWKM